MLALLFFRGGGGVVSDTTVPHGDGGDKKRRSNLQQRGTYKPTGLLDRPIPQGRKDADERVADAAQIAAEVAAKVAREFDTGLGIDDDTPIEEMSLAQIEAEIGIRLRKKLQEEEDIMAMLILLAAVS